MLPIGILTAIGVGCGLIIFFVFLKVPSKVKGLEKTEEINAILPGMNCGACGYAGCADYAKAVVDGEEVNLCAPGGPDTVKLVAGVMGAEVVEQEKMIAYVFCAGTDSIAKKKFLMSFPSEKLIRQSFLLPIFWTRV